MKPLLISCFAVLVAGTALGVAVKSYLARPVTCPGSTGVPKSVPPKVNKLRATRVADCDCWYPKGGGPPRCIPCRPTRET